MEGDPPRSTEREAVEDEDVGADEFLGLGSTRAPL